MGEKRCLGCMEHFPDKLKMCPFCGYIVGTPVENAVHMEPGTLLANRYIVGKVLGYGGFGVTYIGWDGKLRQKVAIKEYFPTEFSTRMPGKTMLVWSNDEKKREQFLDGMNKFIEEAKRLTNFRNEQGIVKIFDAFQENDTAYIIMEYLDGETLTDMLERVGTIDEDRAVDMLMPVMQSLKAVHKIGIVHRDIAPDNIFITKTGEVKLIDFGASRYATTSHSRSITVIIKPGYSPEEQYRSRGDQGPHTDVYALAATLYRMITGKVPPDALERRASCESKRRDLIILPHRLNKNISKNVENALLNALNVRIEDRTPDIDSFIEELMADPPVKRRYGNIKKIDLYQWPLWTKIAIPAAMLAIVVGGIIAIKGIVAPAPPSELLIPDGMVVVPDVEGESMSDATRIIKENTLNVTIAGNIESDYIQPDKIILQDPHGGAYQDRYGNVNLQVSSGKTIPGIVPLLVGASEEEALNKLQEAGFSNIKKSGEEYDDLVDVGLVKSQTPEYTGEEISVDTEITYIISLGSKPFDMPSVLGKNVEEAENILKNTGLKISYTQVFGDEQDVGKIKAQSIEAGQLVKKGDEVILSVVTKKPTVSVESVIGLNKSEAESLLKAQGFNVNSSAEMYSDEYAVGKVIKQTPSAGTSQTEGTTITLVISKGAEEITSNPVPKPSEDTSSVSVSNVVGKSKDIAKVTLENQGFVVSINTEYSSQYSSGFVIKQSPSAGSSQKKGTTVTITVSKGVQKISIPNVVGNNTSSAKSTLENLGFKVSVSESYNSSVTKGNVFSQSPNAGDSAEKGSTVTITVSLGQKPPTAVVVPNVVGKSKSEASSILQNAGLKADVTENYNNTVASGKVVSQSPTSGSSVDKNSTVQLIVSKGKKPITVTLDANGGSISTNSMTVYNGSTYGTLPTPKRNNYKFGGWYTEKSGGTKVTSSTNVSSTSNHTLYAHWSKASITVTLDANGGSVSTSSVTVYNGSSYGDLPTPTRSYYTFDGWYTSGSGGSKVTSSTTVSSTSNHTLYAHWTGNGTSGWVSESEVPSGAKIVDEKWTYDLVTTTTSSSNTLSGYTLYDTQWRWSDYGSWSDWQNDYVSGSDSREADTRYIEPTYKTEYGYSRWKSNSGSNWGPCEGTWSGVYCGNYEETWRDNRLDLNTSFSSNEGGKRYSPQYQNKYPETGGWFYTYGYGADLWYNEGTRQVQTGGGYTQYRYRDRYQIYTYYFKKVESKESSTEVWASDSVTNVKKWVKYKKK